MQFREIAFHFFDKSGLSCSYTSSKSKDSNIFEFSSDKEDKQTWSQGGQ